MKTALRDSAINLECDVEDRIGERESRPSGFRLLCGDTRAKVGVPIISDSMCELYELS